MTQRRVVLITLGVMMSLFTASMESTVIATAMPTIVTQLGGLESYSWVFAIYMLTSTTVGPIFGKLSDIYGRRPIYMVAIALFSVGSLLCGMAGSMGQLIAARAVQGLGAGGLMPLAFIIVGDIFTLEQRTKVQGLFSGVWGVSSVLGPLLGGFIVDRASWHWVFLINLPVAAVAAALVWAAWSGQTRPSVVRPQIDYAGAALLSVGVVALLLGLNDLSAPLGWGLLALAAVALSALVWVELRAPAPILPLRLLGSDRMFAVACAHGVLAGFVLFGGMSFIPLFVQGSYGVSATAAGTTLTPMLMGWVLTSVVASRLLLRVSSRTMAIFGMSLFVVGATLLATLATSSRPVLLLALALMGSGMGASIPSFLIAVQSSVQKNVLGAATASLQFSRQIGGTLGVAIIGVVLSARLAAHMLQLGLDPASVQLDALLGEGAAGAGALGDGMRVALTAAMQDTFFVSLAVAVLALAATFFAPHGKIAQMRDKASAQEAMVHAGD